MLKRVRGKNFKYEMEAESFFTRASLMGIPGSLDSGEESEMLGMATERKSKMGIGPFIL